MTAVNVGLGLIAGALLVGCGAGTGQLGAADAQGNLPLDCHQDEDPCAVEARIQGACVSVAAADGTACPGGSCRAGRCAASGQPDAGPEATICGDAACDASESCDSCALDCGSCPTAPAVASFTLVDTNQPGGAAVPGFDPMSEGATLDPRLVGSSLSLRANTSPATVGSVRFDFDDAAGYRTENAPPYVLCGDDGAGTLARCELSPGLHTVTATPYSGAEATGTAGTPLTVRFTVACVPEDDAAFCARLAKSCGEVSGADRCGQARTVASCGGCAAPQTCGGGGIPNVCGTSGGAEGWAAACAAEPEPAANVIYACDCLDKGLANGAEADCVAGSDANDGRDKSTPVQSWSKIQEKFRALPAGGTVALCKGGAFLANAASMWSWYNASCASSSCTLRDYAPAEWTGTALPLIKPLESQNAIELFGSASQPLSGYRFLNLHFFMPGAGTATNTGFRGVDHVSDVEVCNCVIDGFALGFYVGGAYDDASACTTSGWKIRGNRIVNSCTDALLLSVSATEIVENFMDNNGNGKGYPRCGYDPCAGGPTNHTMYLDGGVAASGGCRVEDVVVRGNEVHRNAICNGYPRGSALSIGARNAHNVTLENNWVDWLPCDQGSPGGASFVGGNGECGICPGNTNITVRRNRIDHCKGRAIVFDSTASGLVEDNVIVVAGSTEPGGAIYAPQGRGLNPSSVVIRNNTVYVQGGGSYPIWATDYNSLSSAHVVTGNSVTFTGTGDACFRVSNPSYMDFMDHNHCHGSSAFATVDGQAFYSLAEWQTYVQSLNLGRQFDAHSITAAPLFEDAPTNLTPCVPSVGSCAGAQSPLVDAASTLGTCTVLGAPNQSCSSTVAVDPADAVSWNALDGARRRTDGAPDIGAIER